MIKKINNYLNSLPYNLFSKINFFYETLITLEDTFYQKNFNDREVVNFIYVCGYPRSGTTVVTNFLNQTKKFSSYIYRDMPLILSPILWSKFSRIYYRGFKEFKRKHQDAMNINLDYSDSFEEVIWNNFKEKKNFFEIYLKNIKKISFLRQKKNYLSKSNQNLSRIETIISNIPNAKFLIIFRNPVSQLKSLLKVNKIFFNEIQENKYFLKELDFLGHYEFGPNRKFIFDNLKNINDIRNNWSIGNYALSYLLEWCDVYEMVLKKYSYQKKIKLVNYDSLKNNVEYEINDILEFSGISLDKKELEYSLNIFNFKADTTQNNVLDENDFELKNKINDAKVIYEKLINASLVSK